MRKKTILYAEDEFTNQKIMQIQCERYGVSCVLAANGQQAMKLIHQDQFDLVILDQYMPGLNGDEIAAAVRKKNDQMFLIAITGDSDCIPKLWKSGFNAVFKKPLKAKDYQKILEAYLK